MEKPEIITILSCACLHCDSQVARKVVSRMAAFACSAQEQAAVLALVGDAAAANSICSAYDVSSVGAPGAVTRWTVKELQLTQDGLDQIRNGLDTSFVLTSAYQVRAPRSRGHVTKRAQAGNGCILVAPCACQAASAVQSGVGRGGCLMP